MVMQFLSGNTKVLVAQCFNALKDRVAHRKSEMLYNAGRQNEVLRAKALYNATVAAMR
jgi:hypothetical protein